MKLIKVRDYKELSRKACNILISEINKNPKLTICFATGQTPIGLYKDLVSSYKSKKIDFSKTEAFGLDEYYPIKNKDKNSYHHYLFSKLFSKINLNKNKIRILNGEAKNPNKECSDYEKEIKRKPIDFCILGVGINGHIGFNEPGSNFNSKTRLISLDKGTIKRNSRHFMNKNKIPKKALTMGIGTILSSKKILLLASGKVKKEAIRHLINDKPNKNWPVTFLKKHKNFTVVIDKEVLD